MHWSITWNATRNLCCAANRETHREMSLDSGVSPQPALRLRGEPAGPFLCLEHATAERERGENGARRADMAAGDAALAGGSLRNDTQHIRERSHRAGA